MKKAARLIAASTSLPPTAPALATALVLSSMAAVPARAAQTGGFAAEYDGYSHGLIVLKLNASVTLTDRSYAGRLTYHTAGLVGWMVHNEDDSQVQGRFEGERAMPIQFDSNGNLRGVDRLTKMTYENGNPVIKILSPPVERERTLVPAAQTANTIDTLSAMIVLVRQVAGRNTCDGNAMAFDGRRLTALTAHTAGHEILPQSSKSRYAGDSLRCDFEGNQLAGFVKSENEDQLRRTRHGTAWMQNLLPGSPPVPVRINFENKVLGQVTLYLQSVTGGPGRISAK